MINTAKELATRNHGTRRRGSFSYEIDHVSAVANMAKRAGESNDVITVCWLHDLKEDCGVSDADLQKAGFSSTIISAVDAITKKTGQTYFDYITKCVALNKIATLVKLYDLTHNMSDLQEGSMKDKYRFAFDYLIKVLEGHIQ